MADDRAAPIGTRAADRYLRRLYNLAGGTVPDKVQGNILPSVDVKPVYPEDFADFGIIPFAAETIVPAVAAQLGFMHIRADTTGTYDVVVTEAFAATVGWLLAIGNQTTWATTGGVSVIPTDSRYDFSGIVPNVVAFSGANAAPGGSPIVGNQPASARVTDTDRGLVVLRSVPVGTAPANVPELGLLATGPVNTAFYAHFRGYLVPSNSQV